MSTPIYRQLSLQQTRTQYSELIRNLREGELDLDAPYQRDHVWGTQRQVNLIRSLTLGLPTGAIYLNERDIMKPTVVIDGKQRLSAVLRWLDGDLAVPRDWFPVGAERLPGGREGSVLIEEHAAGQDTVTFNDLTRAGRLGWTNHAGVAVYNARFTGPDAVEREEELFNLLNHGGLPQGAAADADLAV